MTNTNYKNEIQNEINELVKKMREAKNEEEYNTYRRQYEIAKDNQMRANGYDPITHCKLN